MSKCTTNSMAINTITVDSNVAIIPRLVARLLVEPAQEWCSEPNECRRSPASENNCRAYYDTPISMCASFEACGVGVPDRFLNFVYLDYREQNASLKRILRNIENRRSIVRIVADEGASHAHGTYRIKTSRCTLRCVAEAIATIINSFRGIGHLLHPDDIGDIACGTKIVTPKRLCYNMTYDIETLLARRNAHRPIVNDCADCESR